MSKSDYLTGDCNVAPTVSLLGDFSLVEVFEYYTP